MAAIRGGRVALFLLAATALIIGALGRLSAHEVPNDVLIQSFIKPEGQRLRLLVRVPLVALRDMTWPFKAPDILDLERADSELRDAATLWIGDEATLFEGDRALSSRELVAVRATLPTDRSFESYDQALALLRGPRPADTEEISVKEGFLDVLFEYPLESTASRISIQPRWGRLGVYSLTTIQMVLADGAIRKFQLHGDPGLVHLDPTTLQAARRFVVAGFWHILDGTDHLLFLLALVIPFRRLRDLTVVITAFTVAHSVTLLTSAFGMAPQALWFPPFVDTAIAVTIVYVALENIAGATVKRRWLAACALGLVHGFGFSFALTDSLQFAGGHLMASMLSFNIGVELGQLVVLAIAIPALALLFRFVVPERIGVVLLSAVVAHTAWHWMTTRGAILAQYQMAWPEMTPAFFVGVTRWLIVLISVAGSAWLITTMLAGRRSTVSREP